MYPFYACFKRHASHHACTKRIRNNMIMRHFSWLSNLFLMRSAHESATFETGFSFPTVVSRYIFSFFYYPRRKLFHYMFSKYVFVRFYVRVRLVNFVEKWIRNWWFPLLRFRSALLNVLTATYMHAMFFCFFSF